MGYTREQMEQARRTNERAARLRGEVSTKGEFQLVRQVDPRAYHNAIQMNGGVNHQGRHIWHDPEFCMDMERRHPEIKVRSRSSKIIIQGIGGGGLHGISTGSGHLTRFGRANFHKSYG